MSALIDSWPAILLTFKLATFTVIVLLGICLPFAWWLAHYEGRIKPVFEALIALPLVLPPTVLGFYLLTAFAPNTALGGLWISIVGEQFVFSFGGILFGSIVYSLPFVMQPLLTGFSQLTKQTNMTIRTLGISPLKGFIFIILPIIRPSIISGATLGFAHTLGEFGLILMIGGNIPGETQVVSIALFNQVESLQYEQAHALSLFLLFISFISLTLLYKFNRQARLFSVGN